MLGFIRQAGPLYVALVGDRLDLAEECGQFHSWDQAVAALGSGRVTATDPRSDGRFRATRRLTPSAERVSADPAEEKAGDLLIFRPRTRPRAPKAVARPMMTELDDAVIRHGGREFRTTKTRAESFLVWARAVAKSGQAVLVPLLHSDGVDLLLITGQTPLESGNTGREDPAQAPLGTDAYDPISW